MIRQPTVQVAEDDPEDRSMRTIEYVLAIVAAVAAGILAFVR